MRVVVTTRCPDHEDNTAAPQGQALQPEFAVADVLGAFRASGVGWQTRVNAALKEWLASHAPEPLAKAAGLAAGQGSGQTTV